MAADKYFVARCLLDNINLIEGHYGKNIFHNRICWIFTR